MKLSAQTDPCLHDVAGNIAKLLVFGLTACRKLLGVHPQAQQLKNSKKGL
jgi:hypothetical protein